jgi:hypothetical protein
MDINTLGEMGSERNNLIAIIEQAFSDIFKQIG